MEMPATGHAADVFLQHQLGHRVASVACKSSEDVFLAATIAQIQLQNGS